MSRKLWSLKSIVWSLILPIVIWQGTALAEDFLPPEEAFKVKMAVKDTTCLEACLIDVEIDVAPKYYLYAERFKVEPLAGLKDLRILKLPSGERKFDENLGMEIEALRGLLQFQLQYSVEAGPPKANLISQGCADAGLCYPPMTSVIPFELLPSGSAANTATGDSLDEASLLAQRLQSQPFWVVLPVFFGLGLLLAFTPCTLPMLPIVTSLVVGSRGNQSVPGGATDNSDDSSRTSGNTSRSISLALVYVFGMSLTYSLLGVVAGLSGQSLVIALQQPVVLWSFGGVLAALGLALLMGYSLQMPPGIQAWIQTKASGLKGGEYLPVLLMGILSALLLGPCVAPPLAGALLYIGQTGNALLGGSALFLLSLGMGLPLVLLAGGAGAALPRAGYWMNWVSVAFGYILIAVAVWTITPVTPVAVVMGLWVVLGCLVAASCFQGVASGQVKSMTANTLFRGLGLLSGFLSLVYLIGLLSGSQSLLSPLGKLSQTDSASVAGGQAGVVGLSTLPQRGSGFEPNVVADKNKKHAGPPFEPILSENVLNIIASSKQPVLLDFYADWCVACKEFELFTLTDKTVQEKLSGFRLIRVDVTANNEADKALLKKFSLFGPPALLFFDGNAKEVKAQRVVGFQDADKFSETLTKVRRALGV